MATTYDPYGGDTVVGALKIKPFGGTTPTQADPLQQFKTTISNKMAKQGNVSDADYNNAINTLQSSDTGKSWLKSTGYQGYVSPTFYQNPSNISGVNPTMRNESSPTPNSATQNNTAVYDPSADLDKLRQAQIARVVGGLTNRYNQTLGDINSKKAQVDPTYNAKRVQAQTGSQLQAKNFSEYLANRGLARSGTSQQAELIRNMNLQNTYNGIESQRNADTNYYNQQADSAKTAYNQDVSSANAQAESDYLTQLIQSKAKQDEIKRNEDLQRELNTANLSQKEQQMLQDAYDKGQQRQVEAIKNASDLQDKSVSRQIQTAGLTGNIPVELILNQMSPDQITAYQSIPDYQAVINQTQDPTQKAILNYFRNAKIQGDAGLMSQYGDSMQSSYIPTRNALESDRNYNFDVGKYNQDFNYKAGQDKQNFDYKAGQDQLNFQKWLQDYKLKQWQAQDSSARGWDSNSTTKFNAQTSRNSSDDASLRAWTSLGNSEDKSDFEQIYNAIGKYQAKPIYSSDNTKIEGYELPTQSKAEVLDMLSRAKENGTSKKVIDKIGALFNLEAAQVDTPQSGDIVPW